ncbi:MAG: hypothetical protein FDZ70_07330 [Actinobacteria bacterium]|nr:MAG: hypothetical protein FDZ70_07330 [Actinomycetota bacterium]
MPIIPSWGWWAIGGAGALVALIGVVLLVVLAWRRQERKYVVRLVAQREAVRAGLRSLSEVVVRLAEDTDDELTAFVSDERHLDRKALGELHRQQAIVRDELQTVALPKDLWGAADALTAAAAAVAREAGRVGEHAGADDVLTALGEVDLAAARAAVDTADAAVHDVCERFGLEDAAVYGGGLYI